MCSSRDSGWTKEWLPLNMSTPHPIMSTRPPSASSINIRSQKTYACMRKHLEDVSEPDCGLGDLPNRTLGPATVEMKLFWCFACALSRSQATSEQERCHKPMPPWLWEENVASMWNNLTATKTTFHSTLGQRGIYFFFSGLQCECLPRGLRGEKDS